MGVFLCFHRKKFGMPFGIQGFTMQNLRSFHCNHCMSCFQEDVPKNFARTVKLINVSSFMGVVHFPAICPRHVLRRLQPGRDLLPGPSCQTRTVNAVVSNGVMTPFCDDLLFVPRNYNCKLDMHYFFNSLIESRPQQPATVYQCLCNILHFAFPFAELK